MKYKKEKELKGVAVCKKNAILTALKYKPHIWRDVGKVKFK